MSAFERLAAVWHAKVMADPVVSHAFSHGFNHQHTARLAAYWAEACGGPPTFTRSMASHTDVMRLHAGQGEHAEMDQRAIACFADAVEHCDLPDDPELKAALLAYFTFVTDRMAEYPESPDDVPEGLPLLLWSWGGPERMLE